MIVEHLHYVNASLTRRRRHAVFETLWQRLFVDYFIHWIFFRLQMHDVFQNRHFFLNQNLFYREAEKRRRWRIFFSIKRLLNVNIEFFERRLLYIFEIYRMQNRFHTSYVRNFIFLDYFDLSKNVCFFRIRTANDRWINVHNVYNVSFSSYASISTLLVIETIKRQLNDEKKHIILKNFNLHHFLWSDSVRLTQHDVIDQFLNIVHQTQLRFTFSSNIIMWKTRNSCNIINLIFMFEKLQKKLIHCMIKSKFNQSLNHISISIKIMLEMNLKIERQRKAWKKIDVEKFINFWRDFVASTSLNRFQHVEKYAIRIRQNIKSVMNIAMSWSRFFIETKFF